MSSHWPAPLPIHLPRSCLLAVGDPVRIAQGMLVLPTSPTDWKARALIRSLSRVPLYEQHAVCILKAEQRFTPVSKAQLSPASTVPGNLTQLPQSTGWGPRLTSTSLYLLWGQAQESVEPVSSPAAQNLGGGLARGPKLPLRLVLWACGNQEDPVRSRMERTHSLSHMAQVAR